MTELVAHLREEGFDVSEVIPDGAVHRFKVDKDDVKKSGFYTAYRNFSPKSGQEFYVIVYGSWRGDETKTFCTLGGKISRADKKVIDDAINEAKRKAEAERKALQEKVSKELSEEFESLFKTGASPYLTRKLINTEVELGIRFTKSGSVVVPARDFDGRIWTLQKIRSDGSKQFSSGGRVGGNFHTLGDLQEADIVYVCEGFATGASIHLATKSCVLVCFTGNNLVKVAADGKSLYPDKSFIICGDDDCFKDPLKNPGREYAEEAARRSLGTCVFATFENIDTKPTDFNDLHGLQGLDAVRDQVLGKKPAAKLALFPLGFRDGRYYFTSTENGQITPVDSFSETEMLKLMPIHYWEIVFPGRGASRVDWVTAKSVLMAQCRSKGIFESRLVRGSGVWLDNSRVIVNMGDHLIVDGKRISMRDLKSQFFYTLGPAITPIKKPLTAKECELILECAHSFKWVKEDFGYLLAGAMVTMRVCGALPIRPHVWLTGERASGKSTLFNRFIAPLLGRQAILIMGNSTEAGIRQEVKCNAFPVIFDEFENNGTKSAETLQTTVDLMRAAWSETNAVILKGSSGGQSQSFQARFSALVVSIRQIGLSDADSSRFATIQLSAHGSDKEHWQILDTLLHQIDEDLGERLFARVIKLMPVLMANFKIMKKAFSKTSAGQRFSDQYGMLLAGYALLLQDTEVDEAQAELLVSHVRLEEARDESKDVDQDTAVDHLLTTKVGVRGASISYETTIGQLVHNLSKTDFEVQDQKDTLLNLGIAVTSEFLTIADPDHAEQERHIWKNTRWSKSWHKTLLRLEGAKSITQRFSGRVKRCVRIPLSTFMK